MTTRSLPLSAINHSVQKTPRPRISHIEGNQATAKPLPQKAELIINKGPIKVLQSLKADQLELTNKEFPSPQALAEVIMEGKPSHIMETRHFGWGMQEIRKGNMDRWLRDLPYKYSKQEIFRGSAEDYYKKTINKPNVLGDTKLHVAILKEDRKAVIKAINTDGINLNATNRSGQTALHIALERKQPSEILFYKEPSPDSKRGSYLEKLPDLVELLLKAGVDPNIQDSNKETALHLACKKFPSKVAALLKAGANPNIADFHGYTPLHVAARDYPQLIKPLIEAGANPHLLLKDTQVYTQKGFKTRKGDSVFDLALRAPINLEGIKVLLERKVKIPKNALKVAVQFNHNTDCIDSLLKAGCNVKKLDKNGATLLHKASSDAIPVLIKAGLDPNAVDNNGMTALHYAAKVGIKDYEGSYWVADCSKRTEALLAHGADPNRLDKEGNTALHYLLQKRRGHRNLLLNERHSQQNASIDNQLNSLLNKGADPNIANRAGQVPLTITHDPKKVQRLLTAGANANSSTLSQGWSLLPSAKVFQSLANQGIKSVQIQSEPSTSVLHTMSALSSVEAVQALIRAGAKVNAVDASGRTPLHAAIQTQNIDYGQNYWNRLNCTLALMKAGADVNAVDLKGNTALHNAIQLKYPPSQIELLLKMGADPNLADFNGNTPLHHIAALASKGLDKFPKSIQLLLAAGADPNLKNKAGKCAIDLAFPPYPKHYIQLSTSKQEPYKNTIRLKATDFEHIKIKTDPYKMDTEILVEKPSILN